MASMQVSVCLGENNSKSYCCFSASGLYLWHDGWITFESDHHGYSSLGVFVGSYDRIQPNTWSGAYLCWGRENREAPLRTACPPGVPNGAVSNFEIKVCDGCANPYLALASIIVAGLDGLRRHLKLPKPVGKTILSSANLLVSLFHQLCWWQYILSSLMRTTVCCKFLNEIL